MQRALAELFPSLLAATPQPDNTDDMLAVMVRAVRTHLGMDVGFVSQFNGDVRSFRVVDAKATSPIPQGSSMPMEEGYCAKVVLGHLPQLIPNTAAVPAAMAIPDTRALPIGAHLSVPIRLKSGQVYGTFCCLSHKAEPSLNERDLATMRAFADVMAFHIDAEHAANARDNQRRDRVQRAIHVGDPAMVFQPIVRLADRAVIGHEALARFASLPLQTPDLWFEDAIHAGLAPELEFAAMRSALCSYRGMLTDSDYFLHLNCSPRTLVQSDLGAELAGFPLDRLVIELTEHHAVTDYAELRHVLAPLRARGLRVAVDDAGAGYASMRHVLLLQPDIIKLDISLVRDIDRDPIKHALGSAVCVFAQQTGCTVIAEGVETAAEAQALKALGAAQAQGYYFGRPAALQPLTDTPLRQAI